MTMSSRSEEKLAHYAEILHQEFLKWHPGVLVILCLRICIVLVWCIGSGFSFFSSFTTNVASVLYTRTFIYTNV